MHLKITWIASLFFLISILLAGCNATAPPYELASRDTLPPEVQTAPQVVRESYRFAVANPDVLTQLPCYCGCGSMGHTSNYSCYIAGQNPDGTLIFDRHALGCSICVDITQDAMHMLDEGRSLSEIRTYIDQTYSAFGPSTFSP